MDLSIWFPHFVRINFPKAAGYSNEDLIELGGHFTEYMNENFEADFIDRIWPNKITEIIMYADHPFKTNGYEPALVLHFIQWIEKQIKEHESASAVS